VTPSFPSLLRGERGGVLLCCYARKPHPTSLRWPPPEDGRKLSLTPRHRSVHPRS
jgi:hypothetical protein